MFYNELVILGFKCESVQLLSLDGLKMVWFHFYNVELELANEDIQFTINLPLSTSQKNAQWIETR